MQEDVEDPEYDDADGTDKWVQCDVVQSGITNTVVFWNWVKQIFLRLVDGFVANYIICSFSIFCYFHSD